MLHEKGQEKDLEARRSIFHELLDSDLPEREKTVRRLGAECTAMVSAGTETTAWSKSCLFYSKLNFNQDNSSLSCNISPPF
jgi:hypothetical protein